MPNNKPEKAFKAGAVRASVFANPYTSGGQPILIRKVVLEVRYRDKQGRWKSTNSLSLNEIPKAIAALQLAYDYLLHPPAPGSSTGHPTGNPGMTSATTGNPAISPGTPATSQSSHRPN